MGLIFLALLVTLPIPIWLGYFFGKRVYRKLSAQGSEYARLNQVIVFLVIAAALFALEWFLIISQIKFTR
ncbi:MAG: hypothetical protein JST86_18855 [Bacteroidetes bacterium]|nr:hypothetical protein [Bacteroidota bacterium]